MKFLQQGDLIRLTKGMKVYAEIPEMFVYANRTSSTEVARTDIKIGDVIHSNFKDSDDVKETLSFFGFSIEDSKVDPFIGGLGISLFFDTSKFEGEYKVVATAFDGGGRAMFNDEYPDGHHVFCEKVDNPSIKIFTSPAHLRQ